MEIYIIGNKKNFTNEQINRMENVGDLFFIESCDDMQNAKYMKSEKEKVIAIDPDLIGWELKNEYIEKIPNLKALCLMSTTYSYIDLEYCTNKNIIVTNVPNYSTDSVAEYAVFLMLQIARKLPIQIKKEWREEYTSELCGMQIKGKTAAIIGLGHIGSQIAGMLKGMGVNIIYWSRKSRNDKYEYKELSDCFKEADFIFPTFLINEETKKIISDDLINSMKNKASIISIIGTKIFNKDLIIDKIKNNSMYGFAFENANDNLNNYSGNVMVTSPYAWYTNESLENCIEIWTQSIESIGNGIDKNRVN